MKAKVWVAVIGMMVGVCGGQAQTAAGPNSPEKLPGKGLAQHDFLYCGEWNYVEPQQTVWMIRGGKPVWDFTIPYNVIFGDKKEFEELGDCRRLENGNVLFSTRLGAMEVAPGKTVVWQMFTPPGSELHSVQPIGTDRVLVAENGNPARLLVINTKTDEVEKTIPVTVRNTDKVHGQIRRARMTDAGTFLVAQLDRGRVVEYDGNGKEIWGVDTPSPWSATRLKNGNTLITGDHNGYVKEVDKAGKVVWEIDRSDLAGYLIGCIQEAERLPNGNTVFSNWVPNDAKPDQWHTTVQMFEVTPEKRIVWALRQWNGPNLGPATGFEVLDGR